MDDYSRALSERAGRPSRAAWTATGALMLLAAANGLFCAAIIPSAGPATAVAGAAVMAAASIVVVIGPRMPLTAAAVIAAVSVALFLAATPWSELGRAGGLIWSPIALAWAGSNLARWARTPVQYTGGSAVFLGYVAVAGSAMTPTGASLLFGLFGAAAPILGGATISLAARLVRARHERQRQEERERELLAERARTEERQHLAAEMHDVVSHQVSLMVLHAGALGAATADPEVRAAADEIRSAGSRAIEELRGIIGVLHDPGSAAPAEHAAEPPAVRTGAEAAPGSPSESPPDPATLVAEARAAGQRAELTVTGSPAGAAPHVARAVFRLVQEGLTNARKHAPGAATEAALRYRADAVVVDVVNDAPESPPDPALAGGGSGTGLEGLRQRVGLLGGTLRAAPTADGGFRIGATIPLGTGTEGE